MNDLSRLHPAQHGALMVACVSVMYEQAQRKDEPAAIQSVFFIFHLFLSFQNVKMTEYRRY